MPSQPAGMGMLLRFLSCVYFLFSQRAPRPCELYQDLIILTDESELQVEPKTVIVMSYKFADCLFGHKHYNAL